MKKRAVLNISFSILAQLVTIMNGLIIPRLILQAFGSEVNGLVASLTQFLNYITLLEGGLGSVVLSALYKPLIENEQEQIDNVISAADRFFKMIGMVFVGYTFILAIVYPFFVKNSFSRPYIFALTLILAVGLFIQYFFSITYKLLLQADEKAYFVYRVQILTNLANFILTCIIIQLWPSIHIVKLIPALIFFLQPIIYSWYVRKNYAFYKNRKKNNKGKLAQRWDCFGQNLAYFVHTNTDVVILTLFQNLKLVSVYAVHLMVVNNVRNLVMSISNAYTPILGKALAEESKDNANKYLDQFEFVMFNVATVVFGCCTYLLSSFVLIYTNGISDADYYQPFFAVLITLAEYVYCVREPYIKVAYTTGKFKETALGAYLEAAFNIVISLCLVARFGVIGVAMGTLSSMVFRMVYQVIYIKKNMLFRPIYKFGKRVLISIFIFIISYLIMNLLDKTGSESVLLWIKNGVLSVGVYTVVAILLNFAIDYRMTTDCIKRLMKKRS